MAHWICNAKFLIIEDVMAVAESIELMLGDLGCHDVELAGSVEDAMARIESFQPDAALLDVDLRGVSSVPVAHELRNRGVAFLFMTGFSSPRVPADLAAAPVPARLCDSDSRLLARGG